MKKVAKATSLIFAFVLLLMGLSGQAQAQVILGPTVNGPGTLENGFPLWLQDTTGTQIVMCTGAGCLPPETDPADPTILVEAFYYFAGTDIAFTGGTALAEFFVEALGPDPVEAPNGGIVNASRYRVRLDAPAVTAQTFTFTNPWSGATTDVVVAAGTTDSGNVAGSDDGPILETFTPGSTLAGPINLFVSNGTGTALRLGDAATPAPLANGFVVNVTGAVTATGTDFVVAGTRFAPAGAAAINVDRGTVSVGRTGNGTAVLIVGSTLADGTMEVTSLAGQPVSIPMTQDTTTGRFFAIFPVTGLTGPLPANAQITVTSTDPAAPVGPVPVVLTDSVSIRSATFSINRRTGAGALNVSANSSANLNPPPNLSVQSTVPITDPVTGAVTQQVVRDFGLMGGRGANKTLRVPATRNDPALQSPPAFVTVTSSAGGSITVPVSIR